MSRASLRAQVWSMAPAKFSQPAAPLNPPVIGRLAHDVSGGDGGPARLRVTTLGLCSFATNPTPIRTSGGR